MQINRLILLWSNDKVFMIYVCMRRNPSVIHDETPLFSISCPLSVTLSSSFTMAIQPELSQVSQVLSVHRRIKAEHYMAEFYEIAHLEDIDDIVWHQNSNSCINRRFICSPIGHIWHVPSSYTLALFEGDRATDKHTILLQHFPHLCDCLAFKNWNLFCSFSYLQPSTAIAHKQN